jgi:hypothetical protein
LETLSESLLIAERKLLVCDKMIAEAELEAKKAQSSIFAVMKRISDDDRDMTLLEDERRELIQEQGIFEVEYAQWVKTFQVTYYQIIRIFSIFDSKL